MCRVVRSCNSFPTFGRVDNRQVDVFVSYCSSQGETLIDLWLLLPKQWTADEQRLSQASVPPTVIFRSKVGTGQ